MVYTNKDIKKDEKLKYDVVIIGSGAGGAPVASYLASKGIKVALLEEGGYYTTDRFNKNAIEMTKLLYRDAGFTTTLGMPGVPVPLGRCVGGTTTINSGTCFRTPNKVFKKWNENLGIGITEEEMDPFFSQVEKDIYVKQAEWKYIGGSGESFAKGARKLGYKIEPLYRNAKDCTGEGSCAFGCTKGAKQSTLVSYVPKGLKKGMTLYANTKAIKIKFKGKKVEGVIAHVLNENDEKQAELDITSDVVIVSAGAIYTPVFLKENGIKNRHLGRHLTIHPAARIAALFDYPIEGWKGIPQGLYIDAHVDEGIIFEGIFVPPELAAASFSLNIKEHKEIMSKYRYISMFGFMISDSSEGSIYSISGKPVVIYSINKEDAKKIKRAIEIGSRIYLAGGAKEVYIPTGKYPKIKDEKDIEKFKKKKIKPTEYELMAFHPLGSARIGKDEKSGVVDENLKVYGTENLFISDGSIVPTSLGVNPQVTIMAFSLRLGDYIASKF